MWRKGCFGFGKNYQTETVSVSVSVSAENFGIGRSLQGRHYYNEGFKKQKPLTKKPLKTFVLLFTRTLDIRKYSIFGA